jgi:hypothetical protein
LERQQELFHTQRVEREKLEKRKIEMVRMEEEEAEAIRMEKNRNLAKKELAYQHQLTLQKIKKAKEDAFYEIIKSRNYINDIQNVEEIIKEQQVIKNIEEFELLFNELRLKADTAGMNNAKISGLKMDRQNAKDDYRNGKISKEEYNKLMDEYYNEINRLMIWNYIGFTKPSTSEKRSAAIIADLGKRKKYARSKKR